VHAAAERERLWERDLALLLASMLAMFVGSSLLVAATPLVVKQAGGNSTEAGLANALFFGITVPFQIATPWLMRRYDARGLTALGLALLGLPAIAVAVVPGLAVVFAAMALRGIGFAVVSIVTYALVAQVAPATRRAEALALSGMSAAIPNVALPSAGLYLNDLGGRAVPFSVAGAAALAGIAAVVAMRPREWLRPPTGGMLRRAARQRDALPFFAAMSVATLAYGSLITFTPLALPEHGAGSAAVFLLCAGTLAFSVRWITARVADRRGAGKLVAPGFLVALVGLVAFASDFSAPAVVIPAAVVFGAGLGTLQTGLQSMIYERSGGADYALASLFWNVAWDVGYVVGALALGAVATLASYGYAFWILPFAWLGGLAFGLAGERAGAAVPPPARSTSPT
jgi:MFS family permease